MQAAGVEIAAGLLYIYYSISVRRRRLLFVFGLMSGLQKVSEGTFSSLSIGAYFNYRLNRSLKPHIVSIMSSSPLVLINGGNGFVGYAVLAGTLKAGVRVSWKIIAKAIQPLAHFCLTLNILPDPQMGTFVFVDILT